MLIELKCDVIHHGHWKAGVQDVPDETAKYLIKRGFAISPERPKPERATKPKAEERLKFPGEDTDVKAKPRRRR